MFRVIFGMFDDRRIELYGNFSLKDIFDISIKILYHLDRHDRLLDINLILWIFDLIKEFN